MEKNPQKTKRMKKIRLKIELKRQKTKLQRDRQMRKAKTEMKRLGPEELLAMLTTKIGSVSSENFSDPENESPDDHQVDVTDKKFTEELSLEDSFSILDVRPDTSLKLGEKSVIVRYVLRLNYHNLATIDKTQGKKP